MFEIGDIIFLTGCEGCQGEDEICSSWNECKNSIGKLCKILNIEVYTEVYSSYTFYTLECLENGFITKNWGESDAFRMATPMELLAIECGQ